MILCLDFDGVIHSYSSGWKGARNIPDPPVPGAMEFLCTALSHFDVAIHSSRSRYFGGRRAMKKWLRQYMLLHLWETQGAPGAFTAMDVDDVLRPEVCSLVSQIKFPRGKPPAHVTLDDRALTFVGEWPAIESLIGFKPWHKSGGSR